jgi:hypothetical protein
MKPSNPANMIAPLFFKRSFKYIIWISIGAALFFTRAVTAAQDCPSYTYKRSSQTPIVKDMVNPNPDEDDFELPMPCGGKLFLRHVCIPVKSFLDDVQLNLGCDDCRRQDEGFMEAKRAAKLAGAFTREDLPESWGVKLFEIAAKGDGHCPGPEDKSSSALYYFIGKYEITNWQYNTVMKDECPGWDKPFTTEDPRPKTNVSWFEAVEFTRRYTEWLLKNKPDRLPHFTDGRFGFIRLPTEAEWEYAARGGHKVVAAEMNKEKFFPLNDRPISDYALYTQAGAAKPPERLAWVGTKCPNPLGLFDTAGNVAEMTLDPFRFSIDSSLHGATGGVVIKGGSFRKSRAEVMPGRREEMPFFLDNGAFRSNELGFRVVLSGIVTPRNRSKTLKEVWSQRSRRNKLSKPQGASQKLNQGNHILAEIERLAAETNNADKQKLLSVVDYLDRVNHIVAEGEAETINAHIWEALFAMESLVKYTSQHQQLQKELEMLKNLKTQTLPETEMASLKKNITRLTKKISDSSAAVDYLSRSYIDGIKDMQKFSEDAIDRQLNSIILDQNLKTSLRSSLNGRLEVFREHILLYNGKPDSIDQKKLVNDIVSQPTN